MTTKESSNVEFLPMTRMLERLQRTIEDGSDGDVFSELLLHMEMVVKIAMCGLAAALPDDRERTRYKLLYRLVRADGLGEWVSCLGQAVAGPISQHLARSAKLGEAKELTQKMAQESWQYEAVSFIRECLVDAGNRPDTLPSKVQCLQWFEHAAQLRNSTRGHGALQGAVLSRMVPKLERSLSLICSNFSLFKREWAYLHKCMSGKYRVSRLSKEIPSFEFLKSAKGRSHELSDGIYLFIDDIAPAELLYSDQDLSDFLFPNGDFRESVGFEVLSYQTGSKQRRPAKPYLRPVTELPISETHGRIDLECLGRVFSNLPPSGSGYVHRAPLEQDLLKVLRNDRHPVITIQGRGGIGKTSLALSALHQLTADTSFDVIVWFSARDVDLTETGPKQVKPRTISLEEIAKEFSLLMKPAEASAPGFSAKQYLADCLSRVGYGPTLFVYDNFETVRNPLELYEWLDTNVRLPNKILITTRIRDFKGDYPIEVRGMTEPESNALIDQVSSAFGLAAISPELRKEIVSESQGHPYVIKILLGELAKGGRHSKIKRIVAHRDDILDALFERTYHSLSPTAKRILLTLAAWRSAVPTVALSAVLIRPANEERLNVEEAVEELIGTSLVDYTISESDQQPFLSLPLTAHEFARRKLEIEPIRDAIVRDAAILQTFGAQTGDVRNGLAPRVKRLFATIAEKYAEPKRFAEMQPVIEYVCRNYRPAWLELGRLHAERGDVELAKQAVREYLQTFEDEEGFVERAGAWLMLQRLCRSTGDHLGELHAAVSYAEIPGSDFQVISDAANRINDLHRSRQLQIDDDLRHGIVSKLLGLLEARDSEADAGAFSRMAWLSVNLRDFDRARLLAQRGLSLEPDNYHCSKLARRLQEGVSRAI